MLRHRVPALVAQATARCCEAAAGAGQGAAAAAAGAAQRRAFTSTARVMGGIHMKNQPVLPWRLKRELDEKNQVIREKLEAEAEAAEDAWMMAEVKKMEADPTYTGNPEATRLKKWKRARRKIDCGALFGPYPQPRPSAGARDAINAEVVSVEAEPVRRR